MRIAFVMPSLHSVHRGAEIAFESVAGHLASRGHEVTLIGTGPARIDQPYAYIRASAVPRERFERAPKFPVFRSEFVYEELTWLPTMLRRYRPADYDVVVSCTFPLTQWALRTRNRFADGPAMVFVTQNGDFPARSDELEYRFFDTDGLVCINPTYYERNRDRWPCALIPNGVDPARFGPGPADRARFGLPEDRRIVLMVSALAASKRVLETMRIAADIDDIHFVVAGDGPLRDETRALADDILPGRFTCLSLPGSDMPDLYRCADVFVHASLWESFGNVYVEALASGCPVVAHDNAVTEWILGDHDIRVDTEDPEAFLQGILSALASDPAESEDRSARALRRFGWDVIAGAYEEFLGEVVARHHSTSN